MIQISLDSYFSMPRPIYQSATHGTTQDLTPDA